MIKNTILSIVETIRSFIRYLILLLLKKKAYFHRLTYKKDGFYLDGIKIIDQKATLQVLIMKILVSNYINDVISDTSNYVSVNQINKFLQSNGVDSYDFEVQIRQAIKRIRFAAKSIDTSIIDSEQWKGYKINSAIFVGKL